MNVLVRKNDQERGPYTEAELRDRLKSGVFSGNDLGQVEDQSEWKPLSEILLASVLATDKPPATPSPGRDFTANYPWLREPKVIGGAVVLLLLIFGGINWLNRASEKRKEEAAAARQQAVMQQAQKQSEEYSRQEQERAAKARQAQLDQVKQMMGMTEKAQRDYQEKQKREQEERQKVEQAKIEAEQRQKQEVAKQADALRLAAEAKQKAQEAEFLKKRPKPVAPAVSNTAAPATTAPTITLAAIPLGPLPKERERMVISDDRARIFIIAAQGSRIQGIVDGVAGPLCRKLRWPLQQQSMGAASWRENKTVPGPPPFSPDKKRVAYITELDAGKEAVVIDSVQSPVYDKIGWLGFGPKRHHVAFVAVKYGPEAKRGNRAGTMVTMVDNGKVGPAFDDIALASLPSSFEKEAIVFSADGEHLAYIGRKESPERSHYRVVVDGRADPRDYEEIKELRISRDGQHYAYVVRSYIRNNMGGGTHECKVVLDGRESPAAPFIEKLTLSEDGSRFAYVARGNKDNEPSAVVDKGVKGRAFHYISDIVISANGERLGYIAGLPNSSSRVVVDNGKESVPYDKCDSISVSPDGSILSFLAESSQGNLLAVNGQEFGPFYRLHNNLTYSADGKHWACSVEATSSSESGQFLADGETYPVPKGARYGGSFQFEFRPDKGWYAKALNCELEIKTAAVDVKVPSKVLYTRDGQHVAKIWPNSQDSTHSSEQVTLDDKSVGQSYHRIRDLNLSADGKHIAFSTSVGDPRASNGIVVVDGEEGSEQAGINDLDMTPDGRHIAYFSEAGRGDKRVCHEVVDGFTGPDFDYQYDYDLSSTTFNPDGSLTFMAAMKGQLARYTYPAEALKFMPTMGQTENVTPGTRLLQTFGHNLLSRHLAVTSDGTIYATAAEGGEYDHGFFFRMKSDGTARKIIHSFYGNDEDGNLDAGAYGEVFLGPNGLVYGQAGAVIFRYDPNKEEYAILAKGHDHTAHLKGVFASGSLLFEGGNKYANENNWAVMPNDGSGLEPVEGGKQETQFVAIGPDDAVYSVTNDSLLRQATVYSPPTVLHKFVDSPQDAKRPNEYVTFDPSGVLYGSAQSGDARRSIVYRVNRDGKDYRVLLSQSQNFRVSGVVAGDDGALYGQFAHEKQSELARLSTQRGQPEFLNMQAGSVQWDRPMVFYNAALYYSNQESLVKVQLPKMSEVARINPVVTIKNVAAPALTSAESVSFTTSSGEAIPTAKAPDDQADAAIWQPPAPGSTTIATISKQSPPRGQNRLTSTGANLPNANFGNTALSTGALSQQEASQFAMNTVSAMSAGDVSTLASFYASQVDYQDKGIITNDAVQSEFQQYFARWPQTNWQLAGTVTVQPSEGSRCQITFPVSFEATNPATNKRSTGIARETMILEQDGDGAWKIVRERQTITSRKAEDRGRRKPEREKVYEGKRLDRNIPIPPNIPWPPGLPRP